MATAISKGITVIHGASDAAASWLHDPANIDLDGFTAGTSYVHMDLVDYKITPSVAYNIKHLVNGKDIKTPAGKRFYTVNFKGFAETKAWAQYLMDWNVMHSKNTDAKQYLIIRLGSATYHAFRDDSRTSRNYCKGAANFDVNWSAKKSPQGTFFEVTGTFESVWESGS